MAKIIRFGIVIILLISLSINSILYYQLKETNAKLTDTNRLVSAQVERNIRQAMLFIRDLKENQSLASLQNLQGSVQELAVSFRHWVDLNQSKRKPNEEFTKGLTGIEALRNTIVNHLNNQFTVNDNTLNEYDIEMLDKAYENLDRLSLIYNRVKEQLPDSEDKEGFVGLVQLANSMEEMSRLYRHSVTPNKHPNYISKEKAIDVLKKAYPHLNPSDAEVSNPQYRDGLHYYQFSFKADKDVEQILWVDAIYGVIRNYENRQSGGRKNISLEEAIQVARDFLKGYYKDDYFEEIFSLELEDEKKTIYSFRFTPIKQNVKLVSDAYTINVDSRSGEVIKYSNDHNGTFISTVGNVVDIDEIIENYSSIYGDLYYDGLSVIKTFETRYYPRLTHGFRVDQNQQQIMVYFDALTGKKIYQLYYIYTPIDQEEETIEG